MSKEAKDGCHFNPHQYEYIWSTTPRKGWSQKTCPNCGLWTRYRHNKTGMTASQCDGVDTFWADTRAILKVAEAASRRDAR